MFNIEVCDLALTVIIAVTLQEDEISLDRSDQEEHKDNISSPWFLSARLLTSTILTYLRLPKIDKLSFYAQTKLFAAPAPSGASPWVAYGIQIDIIYLSGTID